MRIIKIQKRGWWNMFTIDMWAVTVEDGGKIKTYNCWAGLDDPSIGNLMWDLNKKVKKEMKPQFDPNQLIGREVEYPY